MSLFNILNIAGSGLNAQTLRLNTVASNLANAQSISSSINTTYKAREPVFAPMVQSLMDPNAPVGVQVKGIVESRAPVRKEYSPSNPLADAKGYIYLPNVNPVESMANMISASRSYQNNIAIMNTTKQLLLRTLSLGQ